jgi:putative transposase
MNHKKLCRSYLEDRLLVRRHWGRMRARGTRAPITLSMAINQRWSPEFASDTPIYDLSCRTMVSNLRIVN